MAKATEPLPLLSVVTSFSCDLGDFRAGELIEATHPAVKRYRDCFGPITIHHTTEREPVVEQATAGPGEKRGE